MCPRLASYNQALREKFRERLGTGKTGTPSEAFLELRGREGSGGDVVAHARRSDRGVVKHRGWAGGEWA